MADLFALRDRVCVITGGAGILGKKMSSALADHGARVAVIDRDAARIEALLEGCDGTRMRGYSCDIRSRADIEDVASRISRDFGDVDVLVNNAAAKSPNFFEPFEFIET